MVQLFLDLVFSKSLLTVESRWLTKGKRPLGNAWDTHRPVKLRPVPYKPP